LHVRRCAAPTCKKLMCFGCERAGDNCDRAYCTEHKHDHVFEQVEIRLDDRCFAREEDGSQCSKRRKTACGYEECESHPQCEFCPSHSIKRKHDEAFKNYQYECGCEDGCGEQARVVCSNTKNRVCADHTRRCMVVGFNVIIIK